MQSKSCYRFIAIFLVSLALLSALPGWAGVSRAIQEKYRKEYENRAMFLRIPIYGERQMVYITGQTVRVESGAGRPRFRVGDQVRLLLMEFGGDEIKLRMNGITTPGVFEFIFKFDTGLAEDFPNSEVFDRAIRSALTEGLRYTEIEEAKRSFIEDQFEKSVREIATAASVERESVLKNIAAQVPAYREAQRDIDGLKSRLQEVSGQLTQAQAENRKLESETKALQAEVSRLKSANAALQSKIEESTAQINRLGEDLRDAKGSAQGYQRELANLQRSLNIRVDTGRDLAAQIAELGQAMRKLQKENEALGNQVSQLRASLDAQQAANARLLGENEALKTNNSKLQATINELTSKGDSLARRYVDLKREKDKLEEFSNILGALRVQTEEEKLEAGRHMGKASVFLKSVLLGSLQWNLPARIGHGQGMAGEIVFSAESIDALRMSPVERQLRGLLGEKLSLRVGVESYSGTLEVRPDVEMGFREIGERDQYTWRWTIKNQGTQDARLVIIAWLRDKNASEIPFYRQERLLVSTNPVRQLRSYLQPIPMVIGILLGFLLFGIVGVFRRPRKSSTRPPSSPLPQSPTYQKKL